MNPAPDQAAVYLAALAEVTSDGLDVIVSELCEGHKTIFEMFVKVSKETKS